MTESVDFEELVQEIRELVRQAGHNRRRVLHLSPEVAAQLDQVPAAAPAPSQAPAAAPLGQVQPSPVAAAPVAEGPDELVGVLEMVDAEIDRRKALFSTVSDDGLPPADLDAYNRLALQPLPPIMLIVDEANSYFDHKNILVRLEDLSRRGRKWGVVIVLAAHNWRAKDVSRGLSAMFPTRVCFRVADDTSGAVALISDAMTLLRYCSTPASLIAVTVPSALSRSRSAPSNVSSSFRSQ